MIVTTHAAQRYVERVNPRLTLAQAVTAIHAHDRAIHAANAFGAHVVKIGTGHKLLIDGDRVISVLPRRWLGPNPAYPVGGRL